MSRVERNQSTYSEPDKSEKSRSGGGSGFGKFLSFIGTLILIVTIVFSLVLAVPRLVGIEQYVVISGSMEPEIPVGSVVYAKEANLSSLEPGDVIVFYGDEGGTPITHRVVENHPEDGEIITKGDANDQEDLSPALYGNIVGKVVLHLPFLGFIAAPLSSTMGKISMVLVIIAAYLLTVIGSKLNKR